MASWSSVIDGLLSWQKPADVHALIRSSSGRAIPVRLRLDRHPWGEVNLILDRPMTVDKVQERLDDAVDDLRNAVRWMAAKYAETTTEPRP